MPELLDQRTMCGPVAHATVAEVEGYWQQHLDRSGTRPYETGVELAAYVSDGRWVADCTRCASGIACWPENPRACCLGCGALYDVVFPPAKEIAAATAVFAARPAGAVNWRPDLGEQIDDLKVENLSRGVPIASAPELG